VTPEIALAASAREWPDRLHRHLLDHGGGRVAVRVMGPDQATSNRYDVLLIDDISSFLTPRLVTVIKRAGCGVVGVFDPEDGPDAKRRLLECGISDVIESDATADEFLRVVRSAIQHRLDSVPDSTGGEDGAWSIAVTGATDGVGATEVSVSLARSLSRSLETVLVDLDPIWPSVAPRLDLPLHPNLRTAVDRILHDSTRVASVIHELGHLSVVGGLADYGSAGPISHSEVSMHLDVLRSSREVLVADLGSLGNAYGAIISRFDSLALVGTGDPVGITRLLRSVDRVGGLIEEDRLVVVVNKALGSRYHESEVRAEISSAYPGLPVVLVPFDRRVSEAMWEGSLADKGRFARSVRRMSHLIEENVDT
jgi:MinD-like ATPase involved in chromosome partitioning or flagellar assembly